MRILAVDPGSKRIGVALSDPTGTIASPLKVVNHISRPIDAATIASLAQEYDAEKIIVGQSLDEEGKPTVQGRSAARLSAAIRSQTDLPVLLWDESHSTQQARQSQLTLGTPKRKRQRHVDDLAAAAILQSFLDTQIKDE
jgi:putative Holliday junction resolvase